MKNISNDSILNGNINTLSKKKVDYRFKIIYFIDILCVIASHCHGYCSLEFNIQGWFNYRSFHMPLFMFSVFPIYIYNLFYGIYNQILKKFGFKININEFSFRILLIDPLNGEGFKHIGPSWFSSSLFFVELYNIIKRKFMFIIFNKELNEFIYIKT